MRDPRSSAELRAALAIVVERKSVERHKCRPDPEITAELDGQRVQITAILVQRERIERETREVKHRTGTR